MAWGIFLQTEGTKRDGSRQLRESRERLRDRVVNGDRF